MLSVGNSFKLRSNCIVLKIMSAKMVRLQGSCDECPIVIMYILESNPHPFYSFRGLKNQMRITIACGLDS
jgi:hypothetical protein